MAHVDAAFPGAWQEKKLYALLKRLSAVQNSKEFQLLEYFIRNKNKVVSRIDIAMNVWDIDFDTKTNVIDVYVNFLRKKIEKDFSTKLIYTQVGMGYVLKENS